MQLASWHLSVWCQVVPLNSNGERRGANLQKVRVLEDLFPFWDGFLVGQCHWCLPKIYHYCIFWWMVMQGDHARWFQMYAFLDPKSPFGSLQFLVSSGCSDPSDIFRTSIGALQHPDQCTPCIFWHLAVCWVGRNNHKSHNPELSDCLPSFQMLYRNPCIIMYSHWPFGIWHFRKILIMEAYHVLYWPVPGTQ